ncbi:excinuclease ABC subunit UvrA [Pedobacter roseus]|uniref:UvrABC system protein A n=1 Tax=Pedobacter roseus TaxID=336820 RepID=A0A7G9QNA4_9SPHI|nr:excinuclease ABC subunit UvrA [Pedobacter roseus]QNN44829.1 excinuclease ABC subunit UvrA [Pedobacter roseus]
MAGKEKGNMIRVRGAREHNLKDISLDIPRDQLVVFTGVSGSGKSSLAFGTLYAEAQRRYLESVSPYARRLFNQMSVPEVDSIDGLPPAVALQQQRGGASTRSSVGSVTTLSNLLRMLYSRAGDYPKGQSIIYAEGFSANTPQGACPECHGLGSVFEVSEKTMVPDPTLTIRERAVASWPLAWQGQNQRDILVSMGYNVDIPWRDLPKKDRDWILFTEETPTVPVYPGLSPEETARAIKNKKTPDYMGTFIGAKPYVLKTFSSSQSELMKKRVSKYMVSAPCPLCLGKRLRKESLSVSFDGKDIAVLSRLSLTELSTIFRKYARSEKGQQSEKQIVTQRICMDILSRIEVMLELGLGYLSLERTTPTLSPGELQRLRLATQVHSNLFGVIYVLDEPSAGLHPADTKALLGILDRLKNAGNSIFVVEHEVEVIRHADWIVDVGPGAGEKGGHILYSGPLKGLKQAERSVTARFLFNDIKPVINPPRKATGQLRISGAGRHNLKNIDVDFPIGVLTCVTGISGSGKSSLVSQVLVNLVADGLGQKLDTETEPVSAAPELKTTAPVEGKISGGLEQITRLVVVDQRPIGRTPRSNLATYTGLFDQVRKRFADTALARKRRYDAGRFSFNVAKGRCPHCQGEGFVMVELLFLPSVYSPCPTCNGSRYNPETLEVTYKDKNIAQVLEMTVEQACDFFDEDPAVYRALDIVREVGLGYLRLGQAATELSGGEAQRIKLATELQKSQKGSSLYVLDEPTTGLHPSDVERLLAQLNKLADAGNTVVVVEHDMQVIAQSDWIIDIGPEAGEKGGRIVYSGSVDGLINCKESKTAPFLAAYLKKYAKIRS